MSSGTVRPDDADRPLGPITRTARVTWLTNPPHGHAHVGVGGRAFTELAFAFAGQQEEPGVTTPGEMFTAAHACAIATILARILERDRTPARELTVAAAWTYNGDWYVLQQVALTVRGRVQGLDAAGLRRAVDEAVDRCRESLGLPGGAPVEVDAQLE